MSNLLEQASLVMIPSGYKEDVVYSEIPLNGAGDLSFTRASSGTRINSAGLVEVCPWNLLQQSENYSVSPWNRSYITVTPNDIVAPNGTTTGNKIVLNNSGSQRYQLQQGVTTNTSLPMTFTFYAKKNQIDTFVGVIGGASGMSYEVQFNLTNGTATEVYNSSGINTAKSIENVGNGWYKCTITAGSSSGLITGVNIFKDTTGNAVDSFYIWGTQFNFGSTAKPYFPTTDRLNVPRLTYQNGGGGCPSLLLEKQSTNLFPNSQTTANWSFSNMSRTANYGISPEGTQNADLLFPTTSGSVTFQSDITTSSLVIGQPFVVSFFIKLNASFTSNAGTNILDIRLSGPTVWSRPTIRVNLETGAVTATNNASYISSTNFGNGWFRITFGATPTGTSGQVALQLPTTVTMNGGSFYIWGLQGEANATYATSYIPTTSSSATRVADECKKSGIGALIGGTSGTVFFDIKTNPTLSSSNYKQFCYYVTSGGSQSYLYLDGANKITTNASWGSLFYNTALQPNTRYKVALVFAPNDFALYINGVSVATASSGTPNNNVDLQIGQFNGTEMCEFVFNQYTHFPTRLTNSELASLTTI